MEEEINKANIARFEQMLRTQKIYYFDADEFEEIIWHYFDEGKINLCKKALKMALDQHPISVEIKMLEVEVLMFEEKYNQALQQIDMLIEQLEEDTEDYEDAYFLKAEIYSKKGDHKQAIEVLKFMLSFMPNDEQIYLLLGSEYMVLENNKKALYYFKKCLEKDSKNSTAFFNVVLCYNDIEKPREFIAYLKSLIERNPYLVLAWIELGTQYLNLKYYKLAIEAFDMAIAIKDDFSATYFKKAYALECMKKYEEAIACYKEIYNIIDDDAVIDGYIAHCYKELQQLQKAKNLYLLSIKKDAALEESWLGLIDVFMLEKDYPQAFFYLEQAIESDENNPVYWKLLGMLLFQQKKYADAVVALQKSVNLDDLDLDAWIKWIDITYFLEEFEKALDIAKRANAQFYMQPEILYRLAGLLLTTGDIKGFEVLQLAAETNLNLKTIIISFFPALLEIEEVKNIINYT